MPEPVAKVSMSEIWPRMSKHMPDRGEAAGRDAPGASVAFELDEELAAQDIERLILTMVGMRRGTGARRDHGFPEREGSPRLGGSGFVDVRDAQHVESRTGCGIAHEWS